MAKFGIGQPVPRTEDPKFLRGQGLYVDDMTLPHQCHGYVLRSPHAHADIGAIDTAAATAAPGVLEVLVGADVEADGLGDIPCFVPPMAFGGPMSKMIGHPILARGRVRHVGDPVAFVVAETLEQAKDAAELIEVDYAPLPAITTTAEANKPGAPQVWDDIADNTWFEMERGDKDAADTAFAGAAHVTKLSLYNNRLSANSLEPRVSIAEYRSAGDQTTLHTSSQGPHKLRGILADNVFKKPSNHFRVLNPDVGGGFGMKGGVFPEDVLVVWASRRLGRPVRWVADRSEGLVSDTHGRDAYIEAEMALDADGKILGLRGTANHNQGAYLSGSAPVPAALGSILYTGVYDFKAVHMTVRTVFTHTTWTGPYRGAGRPESIYVVERLLDAAAREMKIDPVDIRRRNMVAADAMPYQTPLMTVFDSGSFEAAMDVCLSEADWTGFEARRAESEKNGKLRGRGLSYFVEVAGPFNDRMEIRFDDSANVTVVAGTHSHGQGHQTVYAQMITDWLGVPFENIRLVQGDTDAVSYGRGTYGSRSMSIGGSALKDAADKLIEKAKPMAAHLLEAAEADIEFAEGTFTVAGTDKTIRIEDVARASHMPMGWPPELGIGLEAQGSFSPPAPTWPNGCHVGEVEIDPDTGRVELVRYTSVDDSGLIINPLLYAGQIHGGLAQGIGQALCEDVRYDAESGQILSGSFMDYCMPRADDLPSFDLAEIEDHLCQNNTLGVKGAGESGTVGATPTVVIAILDALAPHGVTDIPIPATAERVWQAIHGANAV